MSYWECWVLALRVLGVITLLVGFIVGNIVAYALGFEEEKWWRWLLPPVSFFGLVTMVAVICRYGR